MRTEEQDEQGVRPELIELLFQVAEEAGDSPSPLLVAIATYLRREGHLALARMADFAQIGMPEETAVAMAQDEMAFQIAVHVARSWTTPRRLDTDLPSW